MWLELKQLLEEYRNYLERLSSFDNVLVNHTWKRTGSLLDAESVNSVSKEIQAFFAYFFQKLHCLPQTVNIPAGGGAGGVRPKKTP